VVPLFTGMTKHFIFHIGWISTLFFKGTYSPSRTFGLP
jgi:hypothetical protein